MNNKKFSEYMKKKNNPRLYNRQNRLNHRRDILFAEFLSDGPTRRQFDLFMTGYIPIADTFWLMMQYAPR